jgi:hypothetical protein
MALPGCQDGALVDGLEAPAETFDVDSSEVLDGELPTEVASGDLVSVGGCDVKGIVEVFQAEVKPHIGACRVCHDMTVPRSLLKAPGPPWYHPTDASAAVEYLLANDLVNGRDPPLSRFLLKPIPTPCGGIPHSGGDMLSCEGPGYLGLLAFVEVAAPCVSRPGEGDLE